MAAKLPQLPIYLFDGELRIYTAASKKRPGAKLEKALRATLDLAGLKLLDRVMANQFDLPDTGALEREHLLTIEWSAKLKDEPDLQNCLATYHPQVLLDFCADLPDLFLQVARLHADPKDKTGQDWIQGVQHQLDQLRLSSPGDDFEPDFESIQERLGEPKLTRKAATEALWAAMSTLGQARWAWHRRLRPRIEKFLAGDARVITLYLERGFEGLGKPLKKRAYDWYYERLRQRLEGSAPLVVPDYLQP